MSDTGNLLAVNPFIEGPAGKYFVGREEQLRRFDRSLAALRAGQPAHILVAGVNGRGKTSYLDKLVNIARAYDFLAIRVGLDGGISARHQVLAVFERLLIEVDEMLEVKTNSARLMAEWERGDGTFWLPRSERLHNEHLLQDLKYVKKVAAEQGFRHIVICIDEGERIDPYALSAIKNALLNLDSYLVVLSVRLGADGGDPVAAGRVRLEQIAASAERDIGAARIYVAEVGLDSFGAEQAQRCIRRRLEGNVISFENIVIELIARVAEGLPDRIIGYAHEVYERAVDAELSTATTEIFRQAFIDRHKTEMAEANGLRQQIVSAERKALLGLARRDVPTTAVELTRSLYPSVADDGFEAVSLGVRSCLDRMCALSPFIRSDEGQYLISDAVRRYAIDIALEPT